MTSLQPMIKKTAGYTMLEMLITLAVLTALFSIIVIASKQMFNAPMQRSQLLATKNNLMQALNQYYINNYKDIKHQQKNIPIKNLIQDGYLAKNTLYDPDEFNYELAIKYEQKTQQDLLQLTIGTKEPNSLKWMNPDEIKNDQAIWFAIPHYQDIAGKLTRRAVQFARESDPDDKM